MAPLTPAVMHVLLSLAGGERHGYAILKEVRLQTSNQIRLGPGTLYGTLQRLMESGWVEETDGPGDTAPPGLAVARDHQVGQALAGQHAVQLAFQRDLQAQLVISVNGHGDLPSLRRT